MNCFNLEHFQPPNDKQLNLFRQEWKSKAHCRLYFNGDVGERSFRQAHNANQRDLIKTLCMMERRVDNMLFRCMFAPSVFEARRMASGGMILVNGKLIDRPGLCLQDGDVLQVNPDKAIYAYSRATHPMIRLWSFLPRYIEVNYPTLSAIFLRTPSFDEIPHPYPRIMISNTAAFYSKRG